MTKYQLYCDGYILDDTRTDGYIVASPKLTLKKNKVGGLTFTIHKTHPYYDKIKIKRSIIELRKNEKPIFRGRVSEYSQEFNLSMKADVEDVLSFLNDSLYAPFEFQGSPADLFTSVIENHNAQVQEWQRFKIGIIDTLDNNDYINRQSIEYLTSWKVIESRLLNIGGILRVRYEDDGNYLDWIEGTQSELNTATQIIEYGENIIDLTKTNSSTETYTAILPQGAKIEDANEAETEAKKRLTIEALPDDDTGDIVKSGKWLYSKSAVEKYGWIVAPIEDTTWEDITVDTNLLSKGKAHLTDTAIKISETTEINAADLSLTDEEINSFNFLDYVRVKSSFHGIGDTFLLSKLELPYKDPKNTKITIGETKLTLTDEQLGNKHTQSDLTEKIEGIYKDYATNEKVSVIIGEQIQNNTEILQSAQEIIMTALENYVETGDYYEFQQTVQTQIEQTANDITISFETLSQRITDENGEINNQLTEISKYIRFEDGKIIIGEVDNPLKTVIANGRISFIYNDANEIAYMTDDKLYITNAEILSRIVIGKFAFIPRTNGNLSFKKVI